MIYFNGWIEISDDTFESDFEKLNRLIMPAVKLLIAKHSVGGMIFEIKEFNYSYFLWVGGGSNHDNGHSAALKAIMEEIGELALGSYGLIHVRFPEDKKFYNEFLVYKLARGKFSIERDILLSPCVPVIEDEP